MTAAAARSIRPANLLALLAEDVILSWGWRRRAIAFVSGAIGALAMPPFSLFAAMVAPLTVSVWLIDGSADRGEPERRTVAGIARRYSTPAGGWASATLSPGSGGSGWRPSSTRRNSPGRSPLSVLALPAGLALFPAFGFALARLLWTPGPTRILALAVGLGLSEWARCLIFTGFPWNDLGMAIGANLTLAQIASLVGLHGLTFVAIAIFAAPATLWRLDESRFVLAADGPCCIRAVAHRGIRRLQAR